ncbi:MAG TPA: ABC transporter ATP-binding protein [Solirubrobacterales bacterium]|nr:ABC transporter ATP-binding protein [Solirubrobacterales bacterium]
MSSNEDSGRPRGARVEARDVGRVYPGPIVALTGVSLTIEPGELLALTGPSGSGKTTLLSIIGGLDRATSGVVEVDGRPVETWPQDRYHREVVGFVFQHHYLIPHLTARVNVEIPLLETRLSSGERRERAEALLESVGLAHRRNSLAAHLSGGERQRVAIARAMANEPRLLLADEPTGSLSEEDTDRVLQLLGEARERTGLTIMVVSHSRQVVDFADRSLHLRDGRLSPAMSRRSQTNPTSPPTPGTQNAIA